ncbi:oxidoreductase [Rhodopila sp.]|uniref:oxidoreductase n=1 Tax=Rhodopila sp. TaxID=2480087 RepID=UPI003D0B38F3
MSKTFLITGVSSGFGRAFAEAALNAGHKVAGTVRTAEAASAFEALDSHAALAIVLDVTDFAAIPDAVERVEKKVGPIDVLINNAGYGHEGPIEESSLDALKHQFDVNVFGAVAMIKAVLPYMRQRRTGHIINMTSVGGLSTTPGLGFYHGSKFALEGINETLAQEVKGFGIHVTAIEPGPFRTAWAGSSMVRAKRSIPDYDEVFAPVRRNREGYSGQQPGDPRKAAEAMLKVVAAENPPVHLLLGKAALKMLDDKLAALKAEMVEWQEVSRSTDFKPGAA